MWQNIVFLLHIHEYNFSNMLLESTCMLYSNDPFTNTCTPYCNQYTASRFCCWTKPDRLFVTEGSEALIVFKAGRSPTLSSWKRRGFNLKYRVRDLPRYESVVPYQIRDRPVDQQTDPTTSAAPQVPSRSSSSEVIQDNHGCRPCNNAAPGTVRDACAIKWLMWTTYECCNSFIKVGSKCIGINIKKEWWSYSRTLTSSLAL